MTSLRDLFVYFYSPQEINANVAINVWLHSSLNNVNDPLSHLPLSAVARGLMLSTAQFSVMASRRQGYGQMSPETIEAMVEEYRKALKACNGDSVFSQELAH